MPAAPMPKSGLSRPSTSTPSRRPWTRARPRPRARPDRDGRSRRGVDTRGPRCPRRFPATSRGPGSEARPHLRRRRPCPPSARRGGMQPLEDDPAVELPGPREIETRSKHVAVEDAQIDDALQREAPLGACARSHASAVGDVGPLCRDMRRGDGDSSSPSRMRSISVPTGRGAASPKRAAPGPNASVRRAPPDPDVRRPRNAGRSRFRGMRWSFSGSSPRSITRRRTAGAREPPREARQVVAPVGKGVDPDPLLPGRGGATARPHRPRRAKVPGLRSRGTSRNGGSAGVGPSMRMPTTSMARDGNGPRPP